MFFPRPDGLKKAYVRLAPDYDALDVANKVRQREVISVIRFTLSPLLSPSLLPFLDWYYLNVPIIIIIIVPLVFLVKILCLNFTLKKGHS